MTYLRFPDPSVAAACFIRSCWCEPSGMFFFGLKVLDDRLPLKYGHTIIWKPIELVREELSRRGSDWQYIFEMEHLPLLPTKPSLIEGRYPTVGHFEGKMFSSWACEPGCYSTKPVLKWITCPTADYLSSKMPNCQYSREVVDISFDQLEVELYVQLTLYWVRGLPLICLWDRQSSYKSCESS